MRTLMRMTHNTLVPILILAIFTFAFSGKITAQSNITAKTFKVGLAITPNVSWMTPIDTIHNSEGVRGNFGYDLIVDYLLTENFSISSGVHIFNTKGTIKYLDSEIQNELGNYYINSVTREYDLRYVEVPVSLKARTKQIGYTTVYAQVGLGLALNIGVEAYDQKQKEYILALESWEQIDDQYVLPSTPAIPNDIKLLRSSLIMGLGVEHSLGESYSLLVGATYNSGFINIHKGTSQIIVDENDEVVSNGFLEPKTDKLKGNDRFIELVLGLIF